VALAHVAQPRAQPKVYSSVSHVPIPRSSARR
jgi:hypothetical protein